MKQTGCNSGSHTHRQVMATKEIAFHFVIVLLGLWPHDRASLRWLAEALVLPPMPGKRQGRCAPGFQYQGLVLLWRNQSRFSAASPDRRAGNGQWRLG